MRRLSLSLLAVVLIATIGLGWAIDRLFVELRPDAEDGLDWYRALGLSLAELLAEREATSAGETATARSPVRLLEAEELALPPALERTLAAGEPLALDSESGVTLYVALPERGAVIAISPPRAERGAVRLRIALTALFYGGVILLILAWLLPLARRLRALSIAAAAFGTGALERRVSTDRHSQLHGIESEFNRMASRIETLLEDNRLLGNAVSHDLRTPLARLRLGIEVLTEATDEGLREHYAKRLEGDLTAMERLIDVLLDFARLDRGLGGGPMRPLPLEPLVADCLAPLVGTSDFRVEGPREGEHRVLARESHLRMLVDNLVQNAVRYGRARARITVAPMPEDPGRIVLTLEDDGPGIAEVERERVRQPFVRGAAGERQAAGDGFGMGLAIVERVARWHGGTLAIDTSPALGGARLRIDLERAADVRTVARRSSRDGSSGRPTRP